VIVSGAVDAGAGAALLGAGAWEAALALPSARAALGVAMVLAGAVLVLTGTSRASARLEVHHDRLAWTWLFSRHELPYGNLVQAALVEPGSPASGGAWATLPYGGLTAVGTSALLDLLGSVVNAGPTLGSSTLEVIPKYGAPVRIPAIGTFSSRPQSTRAFAVQQTLQFAIDTYHTRQVRHPG